MKNSKTGIFSLVLLVSAGGSTLHAQAPAPKEGYSYPELLVVPRASQRLTTLANQENKSRARTHFVLQAPAFFTLLAGASAMSMKEAKSKEAAVIASGIGLGWLLGTFSLGAMYTPYRTGQQEITAMSEKTLEQTLAKERRAEEALYFPAYVMRRLQYIATFTNFAGAIAITSLTEENDKVKAVAGVAAVMAFLPLVFDHPWITNYDQQQDYKKRIYGPVAELTILPELSHAQPLEPKISWVPGFAYSLRF